MSNKLNPKIPYSYLRLITHQDVFDLMVSFARLSRDQAIVVADEEFMDWKKEHSKSRRIMKVLKLALQNGESPCGKL